LTSIDSRLAKALSHLGVATLVNHIGEEGTRRMIALGIGIDPESLSEGMVSEQGVNLLKSVELRADLFSTFSPDEVRDAFQLEDSEVVDISLLNKFKWGQNEPTKSYLALLGLDSEILAPEAVEETQLNNVARVEMCLYPYQNWIRKGIILFTSSNPGNRLLVHMPTGAGKTRTAIESISDYLRSQTGGPKLVVWMAHSDELCEQAAESFESLWGRFGSEPVNVQRMWGGRGLGTVDDTKPTFLVTSFQTAYSMILSAKDTVFQSFADIRAKSALLIVDEAHLSTAPTYRQAIELFSNMNTSVVGLTATPGRHHVGGDVEETEDLSKFYGNNLLRIRSDEGEDLEDPIEYLTDKGVLARIERYQLESGTDIALTPQEAKAISQMLDIPASVLRKLGENEQRTNLIVTQVIALANKHEFQTIVFAPSKKNATEIAQMLKIRDCAAYAVTGDTHIIDRRRAIQQFKDGEMKVLVNFGVLTTGFDAPNIEAVVVARPTTSVVLYSQMIGRGLRGPAMGGKPLCHLVDVVDNITNMPEVGQAFNYFNEFYES